MIYIYKGAYFTKKPCRVFVLGQIVAVVMVNKHVKFDKICFNNYKAIAKVKVCHDNDNDADYAADDDDTRVMTLPRLFFLRKIAELIINFKGGLNMNQTRFRTCPNGRSLQRVEL